MDEMVIIFKMVIMVEMVIIVAMVIRLSMLIIVTKVTMAETAIMVSINIMVDIVISTFFTFVYFVPTVGSCTSSNVLLDQMTSHILSMSGPSLHSPL